VTARDRSAPAFVVKVAPEGQGAQRVDLSERVLSFSFEDAEKKADKLALSVDNWDLANFDDPIWKKGTILEVSWGYAGDMAPARQVVIQKVTGFQVLSVEGHAKSILMNKIARCRTFENTTRSAVVRKLAEENGYGATAQDIEDTEVVLPAITQARQTDAQFLRRLAHREGFEFYDDFDGFHFHRRRLGQVPVRVLRWFTPPEVGEILSINVENDVTAKPGAFQAGGRDPLTKKDIKVAGSNSETKRETLAPVLEIVGKESGATHLETRNASETVRSTSEASAAAAKRQVDGAYRRTQHTTVKLSVSIVGDPGLVAKTVVEIQGIGQRLSGKYYVSQASHRRDSNAYVTDLKVLRDGHGQAGVASAGKPNRTSAQDHDPNALHALEVVDKETGKTEVQYRDTRGRTAGVEDKRAGVSRPVGSPQ
jgi:phage protein D